MVGLPADVDDVALAFGLGHVVAPPAYVARGAMGAIWRVVTSSGAWAVKAQFEWSDDRPMPDDIAIQRAAAVAGIPLPRPVVVDEAAVHDVEGTHYRVYEWVDLDPPLSSPAGPVRAEEAGSLLGRVHSLPVRLDDPVVDGWYTTAAPAEEFRRLAEDAATAARPWAGPLLASQGVIEQLSMFVRTDAGPIGLCHRDFDPTNVLPRAGAGPLVVLDWENAGALPQHQELGASLLAWAAGRGGVDRSAVEAFLQGYRRSGGLAELHPEVSFSMAACTALNFLREMADQALTDSQHRSFAEDRLAHFLQRGLTDQLASVRALVASGLR